MSGPRPFELERWFARFEFHVEHLASSSDCETLSVREVLAMEPGAEARLMDLRLGYTESTGHPELRAAIAGLYRTLSADDVLVFSGAQEALLVAFQALTGPGDSVVVQHPCYQSLAEVPRWLGAEVRPWTLQDRNGRWEAELGQLDGLLRGARALVVNSPHNPTGFHFSAAEQARVLEASQRHGAVLVSDEVYRGLEYGSAGRLPAACDLDERAVSVGVTSKAYGLAGLRIGWLASRNKALMARARELKDYTTICAAGPSEVLATVALRHADRLAARACGIIADNVRHMEQWVARNAGRMEWVAPAAGPVAFPRVQVGGDVPAACERLARDHGVMLLPGSVFVGGEGRVRLGLGRSGFPAALKALARGFGWDG